MFLKSVNIPVRMSNTIIIRFDYFITHTRRMDFYALKPLLKKDICGWGGMLGKD